MTEKARGLGSPRTRDFQCGCWVLQEPPLLHQAVHDGKPSSNPKTQEAEAGDLCQLQACQVYTASSRPARDTPCDPVSQKKKLLTDRTLAYHHKVQNSCQNTHTHTPTKMPILKEKNLEQVE